MKKKSKNAIDKTYNIGKAKKKSLASISRPSLSIKLPSKESIFSHMVTRSKAKLLNALKDDLHVLQFHSSCRSCKKRSIRLSTKKSDSLHKKVKQNEPYNESSHSNDVSNFVAVNQNNTMIKENNENPLTNNNINYKEFTSNTVEPMNIESLQVGNVPNFITINETNKSNKENHESPSSCTFIENSPSNSIEPKLNIESPQWRHKPNITTLNKTNSNTEGYKSSNHNEAEIIDFLSNMAEPVSNTALQNNQTNTNDKDEIVPCSIEETVFTSLQKNQTDLLTKKENYLENNCINITNTKEVSITNKYPTSFSSHEIVSQNSEFSAKIINETDANSNKENDINKNDHTTNLMAQSINLSNEFNDKANMIAKVDILNDNSLANNITDLVKHEVMKKEQLYNLQKDIVRMERQKLDTLKSMFSAFYKNLFRKYRTKD